MAGGNPTAGRKDHDFYATPPDVTLALLSRIKLLGPVWEPCCGDGAIGMVLQAAGLSVVGTDLVDRGWGAHGGGHDVRDADRLLCRDIVTNPPFTEAAGMISHLAPMRPRIMALLLKSTYWSAKKRLPLFAVHPPDWILALSWRPDFSGEGQSPTMEVSWNVWLDGGCGETRFGVLERPPGFQRVRRNKRSKAKAA